ncbi:histidine kinase [Micromonospora sp. WMMD1102]|uniref:sensor histidine kinase n=1 Tax=Micromonospora sp. WMMD1102 TaxID=3016105 RepID=UPI002415163B|nr:histidine kinase [Micromonospora sp. WMMD1102]MDG4789112.1 histidine kinase [Micromonospora sp. WMMD1102]
MKGWTGAGTAPGGDRRRRGPGADRGWRALGGARGRRWAVDVGIAAAAGTITAYRIAVVAVLPGDRTPDLWAYALGTAMAVALLARRRWPAAVLAVVGGLFLLYHVSRYPGGAPAAPVWVALYSVAVARRRRLGLLLAGLFVLLDAHGRTMVAGVEPLDATLDSSTVVFVATLLLGETVRGRRIRLALLTAERDDAARRQVVEERIRIARELHDVTAHTLAVVGVQAGVAAEVLDDDPAQARAALEAVRRASREALTELRAAVGVLRDGTRADGPEPPVPGLDRLPALAATTGAVLRQDGTPRPLSGAVEATAYRIVQEAVANAVRHADAGRIEVRLGYRPDGLDLTVCDDGRGPGGPPGNGLRGMAERAAGLGGWLRTGPADGGGFQVRGWLPG